MSARSIGDVGAKVLQSRQIGLQEGERQYRGQDGCRRGCGELARPRQLALGLPQQRRRQRGHVGVAERIAPLADECRQRAQKLHASLRLSGGVQQRMRRGVGAAAICAASWKRAPCVAAACASTAAAVVKAPASSSLPVGVDHRDKLVDGQRVRAHDVAHGVGDGIAGRRVGRRRQRVAPPLQADVADPRLAHGERDARDLAMERRQRQEAVARGAGASSAAR